MLKIYFFRGIKAQGISGRYIIFGIEEEGMELMAGHFLYWPADIFILRGVKFGDWRFKGHVDPPAIFLVWQWNPLEMLRLIIHEFGHYVVWLFTRKRDFIEQGLVHKKFHYYFPWL